MNLSPHFTLEEATFSSTAMRLGIDNTPCQDAINNMLVAAKGFESVRMLLGGPMHIDSWFRCPDLNRAAHGSVTSAHIYGWAADFVCRSFGTPAKIVDAIEASPIVFDQCIEEGTWVHLSFDPRARRQVLVAHFGLEGTTYASRT